MRVRSRRSVIVFACVALALTAGAMANLKLRGLARHPEDIELFNLDKMRGKYDRLILSDSVTENATNDISINKKDYLLMSNGWLRFAGQFFIMRRALERGTFNEIDLFLTPDLLMSNVDDEAGGRIRYTYTDTLFRRDDEIQDLHAAGDSEAGRKWVVFDLLLRSFQSRRLTLPPRDEYHQPQPQPTNVGPLSVESQARLRRRASAFSQFRITPQNAYFLRKFDATCSAFGMRCRFIVEPLPASLPRLDLKTALSVLTPHIEVIDINDHATFPDGAFYDGLHLASPQWAAYYRTIIAERGLMRFSSPTETLETWRGEHLPMGSDQPENLVHLAPPFYSAERWGRWSEGARAVIFVNVDQTTSRQARLVLELTVLAKKGSQHIAVAIDGEPACERETSESGNLDMICNLPSDAWGAMKIEINLSYASSPKEWGEMDNRILGVGFRGLDLR